MSLGRSRYRVRGFWLALAPAALACGAGAGDPRESVGTTSSALTFPNDGPAFDYFVGKGLTPAQAAGIVGNLDQESGVDPTSVQYGGGPGRGIAQWSVGGRWDTDSNDNAVWYAGQQAQNVETLQLQLDFIWYELTTFSGYGLASLRAASSVTDATIAFETDFEGCGTCDQSTRISYAENVLAVFGSGAPTPDAGATTCTVTPTGESGDCIDTSACAALGGHTSTPGYCPGAANIQCCTALPRDASAPRDAARRAEAGRDAAVDGPGVDVDAGVGERDASAGETGQPDAGGLADDAAGPRSDAAPARDATFARDAGEPQVGPDAALLSEDGGDGALASSGGCSVTGGAPSPRGSSAWLLLGALVGLRAGDGRHRARRRRAFSRESSPTSRRGEGRAKLPGS